MPLFEVLKDLPLLNHHPMDLLSLLLLIQDELLVLLADGADFRLEMELVVCFFA